MVGKSGLTSSKLHSGMSSKIIDNPSGVTGIDVSETLL